MRQLIGTAGWSVPATERARFPSDGTSLQRYAQVFCATEINSSFHRSHRRATWQRWAESVPDEFRFSVKLPKRISHVQKLVDCGELISAFFEEIEPLGHKLAILLLQLPPKLAFEQVTVRNFLDHMRLPASALLVCEPRHPSWFESEVDKLLDHFQVASAAADPACVPAAAQCGGWRGLSYYRLHGSPRIYRSSYDDVRLRDYAEQIRADWAQCRTCWCIFDNTASSAAVGDALRLGSMLEDAFGPGEEPALSMSVGNAESNGDQ